MAFSEVPEHMVKNMTMGTGCCRMMVKVWKMEKLPEAVWAKRVV